LPPALLTPRGRDLLSHVSDKVYLEPGTGKEEDEEREQETSFEERKVPIFRFFYLMV